MKVKNKFKAKSFTFIKTKKFGFHLKKNKQKKGEY